MHVIIKLEYSREYVIRLYMFFHIGVIVIPCTCKAHDLQDQWFHDWLTAIQYTVVLIKLQDNLTPMGQQTKGAFITTTN